MLQLITQQDETGQQSKEMIITKDFLERIKQMAETKESTPEAVFYIKENRRNIQQRDIILASNQPYRNFEPDLKENREEPDDIVKKHNIQQKLARNPPPL